MTHSTDQPPTGLKRTLTVTAPFFLVLACIISINLINWWSQQPAASPQNSNIAAVISTPQAASDRTIANTAVPTPLPSATPSATPYIPPQYSAGTTIQLLGPPTDNMLMAQMPITLYWAWHSSLLDDQYFAIYLVTPSSEQQVGTIDKANLGTQFQWQLQPQLLPADSATFQWQIRLYSMHSDSPLMISETRTLTIQ